MARDFSPEYLKELEFPNLATMHCLIKARPLLTNMRRVQRLLVPKGSDLNRQRGSVDRKELVNTDLESASSHFQSRRWAFMAEALDRDFHERLLSEWPKRKFFNPPADLLKSYDRGFEWSRGQSDPPYLGQHPALNLFLDYLRSNRFSERISTFAGASVPLSCYSFLVTNTWTGSVVAPHRDTVAYAPEGKNFLNIVFYINGSGGHESGGLTLLKDNTFNEVIFESLQLRNTALVYDVSAPFYHGFKPVMRGKFRWAIITNFCATDFQPSA